MAPLAELVDFLHQFRLSSLREGQSDAMLLHRFASLRDSEAFTTLVHRHAPMVLGVCQRRLRHRQDIEDAFQATFLVLSRRAGEIRQPDRLGNWLFGVAQKTAAKLQQRQSRRKQQPLNEDFPAREANPDAAEWAAALDDELSRLPERNRLAVVLCCLEGRSREDAAREMGESPGSVKGLLERARQRLRERLQRRGFLEGNWNPFLVPALVSPRLIVDTAQGAFVFLDHAAENISATLALEVINAMNTFRWKCLTAAALLVVILAGTGYALQPGETVPHRVRFVPTRRADPKPEPEQKGVKLTLKHDSEVLSILFTKQGILTGTQNSEGFIWDPKAGTVKAQWKDKSGPVGAIGLGKDDGSFPVLAQGDSIIQREFSQGRIYWSSRTPNNEVISIAVSPDNKEVLAVVEGIGILRRDSDGRPLANWKLGELKESLRRAIFSPDGKQALVAGQVTLNEGTNWISFNVVDTKTGQITSSVTGTRRTLQELPQTSGHPCTIAFSPNSKHWAGADSDHTIHLGDTLKLKSHKKTITALAYLPDGKTLISADRAGVINLWTLEKIPKITTQLTNQGDITTLAVSRDGKLVAWATKKEVTVRDVATLQKDHAYKGVERVKE